MLLLTGEMVVAVSKHDGIGGRNQEFSLSAASVIFRVTDESSRLLWIPTEQTGQAVHFIRKRLQLGCDCLAGGMVDGYTAKEAEQGKGINICAALHREHDSSIQALWELR